MLVSEFSLSFLSFLSEGARRHCFVFFCFEYGREDRHCLGDTKL